jgi:hypothetical protein
MIDTNPLVWMSEVNGIAADARRLPPEIQVQAWQQGLIPYVPGQADNAQ